MTKLRLYLAHPILVRESVRERELKIEERTGIELMNPFYDTNEQEVITELDKGKITLQEYATKLKALGKDEKFVIKDLKLICKLDGIVAVHYRDTPTFGTPQEVMWAAAPAFMKELGYTTDMPAKPVFIVTNYPGHIWGLADASYTGGGVFETWSELEAALVKFKAEWDEKHLNGNGGTGSNGKGGNGK